MRRLLILVLAALAVPVTACQARPAATEATSSAPAPLELTGRVVDAANIFDAAAEERLTKKLAALEDEVGPQIVVVSTPSLEGRDIKDYSIELGNRWGVGDTERDDGLLLVVAPTERKVRIELGLGLETSLSDELCAEIIENDILPYYRKGDLVGGTLSGVDRLDSELRKRLGKLAA